MLGIIVSWVPFFSETSALIFDKFSSTMLQAILSTFHGYNTLLFSTKSHGIQECASMACAPYVSNSKPMQESSLLRSCMKVATLDKSLASCSGSDDTRSFHLHSFLHGKHHHSTPASGKAHFPRLKIGHGKNSKLRRRSSIELCFRNKFQHALSRRNRTIISNINVLKDDIALSLRVQFVDVSIREYEYLVLSEDSDNVSELGWTFKEINAIPVDEFEGESDHEYEGK